MEIYFKIFNLLSPSALATILQVSYEMHEIVCTLPCWKTTFKNHISLAYLLEDEQEENIPPTHYYERLCGFFAKKNIIVHQMRRDKHGLLPHKSEWTTWAKYWSNTSILIQCNDYQFVLSHNGDGIVSVEVGHNGIVTVNKGSLFCYKFKLAENYQNKDGTLASKWKGYNVKMLGTYFVYSGWLMKSM